MRLRPLGSRNNASNITYRYIGTETSLFRTVLGDYVYGVGGSFGRFSRKEKLLFSDKVFFLFFCHFFSNNPFPVSDLGHIPILAKYILTNFRCSARRIASAPLQLQIARKMLSSKLQRNPARFRLSFFKRLLC